MLKHLAVVFTLTASLTAFADEPTVHVTTYEYVEQSNSSTVTTEYREWSPEQQTDQGWQPGYSLLRASTRQNGRRTVWSQTTDYWR